MSELTQESVHLAHHADRVVDRMTKGDFFCDLYCYCGKRFTSRSWESSGKQLDDHLDCEHDQVPE